MPHVTRFPSPPQLSPGSEGTAGNEGEKDSEVQSVRASKRRNLVDESQSSEDEEEQDDDDAAPEAVTLGDSKKLEREKRKELERAEAEKSRTRKERNRARDEALKVRSAKQKKAAKDPTAAATEGGEIENEDDDDEEEGKTEDAIESESSEGDDNEEQDENEEETPDLPPSISTTTPAYLDPELFRKTSAAAPSSKSNAPKPKKEVGKTPKGILKSSKQWPSEDEENLNRIGGIESMDDVMILDELEEGGGKSKKRKRTGGKKVKGGVKERQVGDRTISHLPSLKTSKTSLQLNSSSSSSSLIPKTDASSQYLHRQLDLHKNFKTRPQRNKPSSSSSKNNESAKSKPIEPKASGLLRGVVAGSGNGNGGNKKRKVGERALGNLYDEAGRRKSAHLVSSRAAGSTLGPSPAAKFATSVR